MFDTLISSLGGLRSIIDDPIAVIVELLLIGLSVNWCAGVLHGTRGTRPLRGVLTVLVVATLAVNVLATQFDWPRLALLYRYFVFGLAFVALIAFQPELRRAVIRAGDVRFLRRGTPRSKVITSLAQSARYLSKNRYGGLIAIQQAVDLGGWAEKGTILNAEVSANLLNTIFFPNSPLHDLGVIIAGNRIVAANCQFPVAESDEVSAAVGSRHLAAVGMSYESDALVLVVSEETGTISLADSGKLTRYLSIDDLADELTARLSGQPAVVTRDGKRRLPPLSRAWRVIRRGLVVVPLTLIIWILANQASQIEIPGVDVQIDVRVSDPDHVVDTQPERAVFKVTFRGTARAIEALRAETSGRPFPVDWVLQRYRLEPDSRPARELLNSLPEIQRRGLSVVEVSPEDLRFVVDELVTVTRGLAADTGRARVEDLRFEPERVQLTLRKRDLKDLPEMLELSLEHRLHGVATGERVTLTEHVPDLIGDVAAIDVTPKEVDVSLRIVGQRITRTLTQIPVWYWVSPEILDRYELVRVDPQEWLIEVEVEGDQSRVESLRPREVRAFVSIVPSDLVTPAQEFNLPVEFRHPEGITVQSKRALVRLRLIRREEAAP